MSKEIPRVTIIELDIDIQSQTRQTKVYRHRGYKVTGSILTITNVND